MTLGLYLCTFKDDYLIFYHLLLLFLRSARESQNLFTFAPDFIWVIFSTFHDADTDHIALESNGKF